MKIDCSQTTSLIILAMCCLHAVPLAARQQEPNGLTISPSAGDTVQRPSGGDATSRDSVKRDFNLDLATVIASLVAALAAIVAALYSRHGVVVAARIPIEHSEAKMRFEKISRAKTDLKELYDSFNYTEVATGFIKRQKVADLIAKMLTWGDGARDVERIVASSRIYFDPDIYDDIIRRKDALEGELAKSVENDLLNAIDEMSQRDLPELSDDQLVNVDGEKIRAFVMQAWKTPSFVQDVIKLVDVQLERLISKMGWY